MKLSTTKQYQPYTLFSVLIGGLFLASLVQAEVALPAKGPIPFSSYDLNSDSYISIDEFKQIRTQRVNQRKQQGMPVNARPAEQMFANFDQNKDGQLSPDELAQGQQMQRQRRQAMGMGRGRQGMGAGQQRGGRNRPQFSDFDKNNDGYISEQELVEFRSMRISQRIQDGYRMRNTANIVQFKDIDRNSDGKISPEEFYSQQQKHRMNKNK